MSAPAGGTLAITGDTKVAFLKILHVLDHSLPLPSGYSFRSRSLLRAQRMRGWQPVVLTSPKHEESWTGPQHDCEEIDGVRHYRTGSVSGGAALGELRLMSALRQRLLEVGRIERPDLVHVHSPVLNALPALFSRRRLRVPVVYEIRAFWEDAAAEHGTYARGSLKYRLVRMAETWACGRADQVVTICRGLERDLLCRGIPAGKVGVVFNGIELEEFTAGAADAELARKWGIDGKKAIGFIGSFYRYEGLDLLVEAAARLSARRSDTVLLLVGGGDVENELKERVTRLRLEGRVVLTGRVDHRRVAGVYGLCQVLAYPRYASRLTDLVTPLKPLEAMATAKALVASDVGGHRELIRHGETGLLFPPGDLSALVRSLETLLDDPMLRQRLEQTALAWVRENHTWEKTTAAYRDTYARALAGRRGMERV